MRIHLLLCGALLLAAAEPAFAQDQPAAQITVAPAVPTTVGIVGLSHDHVHGIFNAAKNGDIRIVGIVESDKALAKRYADQYGFSMALVFDTVEQMIDAEHPQAVSAFGPISDHVKVVRAAAPRHVSIMVEKPLALNLDEAKEMAKLAADNHIQLVTNYETTWYASGVEVKKRLDAGALGPLRKLYVRDGHKGPKEIGVSKEFLSWLTDPKLNGGGAVIDFGCYGANIATWLTHGVRPLAVTAVTRQFKPDVYPKVDDDATIVVDYPGVQVVIAASWNWPVGRKDMEVYGRDGQIMADDRTHLRVQMGNDATATAVTLPDRSYPFNDPFSYLNGVIKGEIKPEPYDPSSVENNLLVMEILDAARQSAKTGKTVKLKP